MEQQSEQQELKDIIASREDGFGFLFKQARNERNLAIGDIARELHLDKKVILALENEDHTQLPASAFVCGYIRNYAKFLNIQPEPLIEYYKKERSEDSLEPKLKVRSGIGIQSSSSILSALIMPFLLLLVIAALTAGAWQLWPYISETYLTNDKQQQESLLPDAVNDNLNNDDSGTLLLPDIDTSYEMPAGEEVIEQELETLGEQSGKDISLPLDNDSQEGDVIQSEEAISAEETESSLLAEGSLPAEGSLLAEGSTQSENSSPGSDTTNEVFSAEVLSVADNLPVEAAVVSAISSDSLSSEFKTNQLVMEFSGNSWISIKDSDNKILSTGLKKTGKILRLDGKLPYKVFLGDARMVTISINGHVFDHSSYINDKNVARFKVK